MRSAKLVPLRRLFSASLVLCAWLGVWAGLFSSEAKADSWEQRAEGPGPRASHTAVWTGHEMIVWGGGVDGRFLNDGGRYNPETDVWRRTSPSNAPSARWFHAAVWTGTEMLIWGGRSSFDGVNHRRDGARYNPLTDRWTRISTNSAPAPRSQMAAVWTGTEMIVWGGFREGGGTLADGAHYNPTTDTWTPMAPAPLEGRAEPTAVWTGTELIVFGGVQYQPTQRSFGDGARYDPATDTWNLLSTYGSPGSRTGHTAIWLDGMMLIWGGRELPGDTFLNNGARYNYRDDSWGPITQEGAPEARMLHAAVWTGTEMIVWGGQNASSVQINTGSRYSLSTLEWTPTAQEGAPGRRMFWRPDLGIWAGKEMIVYGGSDYPTSLNSTFVYRPVGTNEPPPPPAQVYDLAMDYSAVNNPNGPWSYGWKPGLDGTFTVFGYHGSSPEPSGGLWDFWVKTADGGAASVYHNAGTLTITNNEGHGVYPPGTVVLAPGYEGSPDNFGVIRFTTPENGTGTYGLTTAVRSHLDGLNIGDADFHVVKNGIELFGLQVPANSGTAYSNQLFLVVGDTIDFLVGRGEDGREYGSGLKIAALLTRVTNAPPPPPVYDVAQDYSTVSNPNGPWSYGWKRTVDGEFSRITYAKHFTAENGVPIFTWLFSDTEQPSVSYVIGPGTAVSAAGQFVAEPGTVYFTAGDDDTLHSFGAIRFTVPRGQGGRFRLETSVRDLFDGSFQGDTDYHVARNGEELFGGFLPPHATAGYTNVLALAEGDVIDFLIGRGEDGHQNGSGLKLLARLTPTTNAPPLPPPPGPATFDLSRDYSLAANPNGPWSYGYLTELNGTFGLLGASRTFSADNGVPIAAWELNTYQIPGVWKVLGPGIAHSDGDHFTAEPGTVYFAPGADGAPQNFGAVRFMVPAGRGGQYRIETSARSLFDFARSRDADFHVLRNGHELFGQFLPPNSGTSYSNVVALGPGDTIDFAIGRGADGTTYDTGLKIQARLTLLNVVTNPPPLSRFYDMSRDFSPIKNPAGAWSYGYQTRLGGAFTLLTFPLTSFGDNPVPVDSWSKNGYEPVAVYHNGTTNTSISDGGAGVFPPGTTWFYPGVEGNADNFGVIRFTVPRGGAGTYGLRTEVRAYLDGPRSGDTDFHVLRNGVELLGQFVPGNSGTSYSNRLSLVEGDTVDFAVGRGQDNIAFDSGLKIRATLELVTNVPPPPPPPPPGPATFDLSRDYSLAGNPNGPWSYGYLTELDGSFGLARAARTFSSDNGVPIAAWELDTYQIPGVWKVLGPGVAHSDGDHFTAEPGTVYFAPGADGAPQNFGAIRFTLPRGAGGAYRLDAAVRSLFDHARSRDADFHVLKNGRELFGQFLPPNSGTTYSNVIALMPGDIVDFAIGRGADGLTADTGLKIQATLTLVTNAPPPPPPPGPCAQPAPGIVAWWPAEGNPNDLVGTNRGELFGGTTYSAGKVGRAFAFPGDSSGIRIPAGPGLNVGAGLGLTIEGWVNPADLSMRGPLVEWNRGGSNIVEWGVHLYILRPDEFGLGEGNLVANLTESNGAPHFVMAPGGTLHANIWQHIALTYDKDSGESRLYRNGEVVASENVGAFTPETSCDLYLGRRSAGDALFSYHGQMDEFAIYNRALSETEVQAIAHASAAGKCRTPAALDELVELVQSIVPPVDSGPLLASLDAVRVSIDRGNLYAALRQLEDFQDQVRSRLGAVNPALSAQIIALAQFVIETLDPTGARRLTVLTRIETPLRLERLYRPAGNAWCVEGIGLPGIECCVQRSVDLLNWEHAGFATEMDDGRFEFIDPLPPDGPVRFYRLQEP